MAQSPENISLNIAASEIADVDQFERLRREAYRENSLQSLSDIVLNATLNNGENLFDQFASILDPTDPSVEASQAAVDRAARVTNAIADSKVFYRIDLNIDGEITDILRGTKLPPEKEPKIEKKREMTKRLPNKRPENNSGFSPYRVYSSSRHR